MCIWCVCGEAFRSLADFKTHQNDDTDNHYIEEWE